MPDIPSISVGEDAVLAVPSVRNIEVLMDHHLTMQDHITSVWKASYMHLRSIARIRKFLTQDATATLINSLVTSRIDNLNSLLVGLPDTVVGKLQKVQNNAAKIVVRKKKSDHVTPILTSLHWLPVQFRIEYKLNLLTFKCLNGLAPEYLATKLRYYKPSRLLRSVDQSLLVEPRANQKTYGDRSFSVAAPRLWNRLPLDLRQCTCVHAFKKNLKTVLFRRAFDA